MRKPSKEEVLACQIGEWYPCFRSCFNATNTLVKCNQTDRNHATIRSVTIPLPKEFLKYLLSDGLILPEGANVSSCANHQADDESDSWGDDETDERICETNDEGKCDNPTFSFLELNHAIERAIDKLGGAVVPKLNWSCPKDATWMNGGTLKCHTAGDVYVLLKSSDFVLHDILYPFGENDAPSDHDFHLTLRKWCNMHRSMEFRCFVASQTLVAISQRDHTQFYPFLKNEIDSIEEAIVDFFEKVLVPKFTALTTYVFDCYVDQNRKVWLVDFNVWGLQTDSLLLEWHQLEEWRKQIEQGSESLPLPNFFLVESDLEVHHDPLASYRAPIDAVELATGRDPSTSSAFEEFMAKCAKPSDL